MSRIALLANPESGSGDADEVEALLRDRRVEVTRFGLDEQSNLIASRPERIVVAGGDGSIGSAAEVAVRAGVALAVVPVGTANDFARAIGIPLDHAAAVEIAARGKLTTRLELGRADGRPFVNAASAGLSPVAARRAHGLKRLLGPFAYATGALRAGLTATPVRSRVRCDGVELFSGRAWQVTVACTGAFGGGAAVAADPHDGILDVVVIEAGSRARLAVRAYGLRAGRIEAQSGVITGSGREVEVDTDASAGFNVDGELLEADRLRLTVDPRAFEVVVG
ncbi:MAG: methylglyoxal synthase [Solirubrobacterales bacterium]|nr:methylglyoxal synthase [Solirubrobacterales bacterium]